MVVGDAEEDGTRLRDMCHIPCLSHRKFNFFKCNERKSTDKYSIHFVRRHTTLFEMGIFFFHSLFIIITDNIDRSPNTFHEKKTKPNDGTGKNAVPWRIDIHDYI